MPLGRYGMPVEARRSYWYQVKERILANPEVEAAAIVTAAPLGGRVYETNYNATPGLRTLSQNVDPEYFGTMQIRLLSGRIFNANEPGVMIVSRRLALEMYGTLDVLGREFPSVAGGRSRSSADVAKLSAPEGTVIGVAADAHSIKVGANDVAELYRPLTIEDFAEVELVARARTDADRLPPILREAATLDPRIIPTARAMHEDFDRHMQGPRMASAIAAGIGVLTLALACLGIFGVVSYGVSLRTKEIGIRVALGAQHPALLRAIVRQVLTPVAVGVADWTRPRHSDGDGVAVGTVLPREHRSDCVRVGPGRVRRCRRRGGVVAGVPGAAAQSRRRTTALLTLRRRPCRRPSSPAPSRRAGAVRDR